MCELKIPLRTLLEHPDFELFARFAEMDTNRAHPIRFISDPGSKIWGEFQRFVKTLARLLPQATDLEGFRTMCGAVKIDQKLIFFHTRGRRFARRIAKKASKIQIHELGEIEMSVKWLSSRK